MVLLVVKLAVRAKPSLNRYSSPVRLLRPGRAKLRLLPNKKPVGICVTVSLTVETVFGGSRNIGGARSVAICGAVSLLVAVPAVAQV